MLHNVARCLISTKFGKLYETPVYIKKTPIEYYIKPPLKCTLLWVCTSENLEFSAKIHKGFTHLISISFS
jgi:hypothetical protein